MDGGLGLFGLGLFLLSIAMLYARQAFGLAWPVLALALLSLGFAMSESPRRREVALGVGVGCVVGAALSLAFGVAWWWVVATALFGVAYLVLWAEFRFPYFGHTPLEASGPDRRERHIRGRRR